MDDLFVIQKKFGKNFRNYPSNIDEKKTLILAIQNEIHELLDTLPWKDHRKWQQEKRENQLEELVDIMKYWMELVMAFGFTWEDVKKEFYRKSAVVEQRYIQEFLKKYEKVIIVDIDGVITDYPNGFTNIYWGNVNSLKSKDIQKELGITSIEYREIKEEWRKNGGYGELPPNNAGIEIVRKLKRKGFQIVFVTNRPVHKYKRIYADTIQWLDNYGIEYDALIFKDDEKIDALKQIDKNNIIAVIEDNPDRVVEYQQLGMDVFVPMYKHNKHLKNVHFYNNSNEFFKKFKEIPINYKN